MKILNVLSHFRFPVPKFFFFSKIHVNFTANKIGLIGYLPFYKLATECNRNVRLDLQPFDF